MQSFLRYIGMTSIDITGGNELQPHFGVSTGLHVFKGCVETERVNFEEMTSSVYSLAEIERDALYSLKTQRSTPESKMHMLLYKF